MLRRQLADRRNAPPSQSQPTTAEKWTIYITSTKYLQAERQSGGQRWKGIGVQQERPPMDSRRLFTIARVRFATLAKRNAVIQELSTLEADSNVLYLVKVVTAIIKMTIADRAKQNPAEKRITGFEWTNKLAWEEKYWRMIETYADGFGGVVEGQGKERYDVLLNARTQASKKGDNAMHRRARDKFAGQIYSLGDHFHSTVILQLFSSVFLLNMLHSFTSRFISILLLCNLAAVAIASPLVARLYSGWHNIQLGRELDGRQIELASQPTTGEKWSIRITNRRYLQATRQSNGLRWKGIGVQQVQRIPSSTMLTIAQVQFAKRAQRDAILQELSTLEADSNLLYLVKVVTTIRRMIENDLKILNPAEKRITGFRWTNKLTWQERYWKMIETYADGFGGVVEGQGKVPYDLLLNARTQASIKGDNASTQSFT
ncbi:hypothetical protein DFJ43DRAFT_1157434 [Lentinula guzmanii]|uniref:Uncharacterized protein n=1 Tax=Lentinula guzmanii TaxID=2804957 RepID=A0AA38JFD5_9AGAR|nr:hypothetical protein DFJ43DRAFT_1157434 [Lentinula guzmanii]